MTYKKKLIEVALPLVAINAASAREKSIRHGHPSTLHLWWARRPLAAARAVIWASLVDDPSAHPDKFPTEVEQETERNRLFRILEELVKWENSNDQRILGAAHAEVLNSTDGDPPPIVDPFCGGGSIPLEAQRLGLEAVGGDLNPVAVLISKAMVEIPPRFAGRPPVNPVSNGSSALSSWQGTQGLAEDVRYFGQLMNDRALQRIGHLYPQVALPPEKGGGKATVVAWMWARTVRSPDPTWSGHVPLVSSWIVRKGSARRSEVWIEPKVDHENQTIRYAVREGGSPPDGTIRRAIGRCIATGAVIDADYIKAEGREGRLGATLIAVIAQGERGRVYLSPDSDHESLANLPETSLGLRGAVSTHSQYMGMPRYGLDTWEELFLPRQKVALSTFYGLLDEVHAEVRALAGTDWEDGTPLYAGGAGAIAYADAIVTYLAFVADRCASRWTSLAIWHSLRETIEHIFRLQAFQMSWAFVEANPFSSSTGNWNGQIDWVAKAIERLPATRPSSILQRDATALLSEVSRGLIATDPPYYDNVPFSDLSDFFYVWLRRFLSETWPEELSTILTPKSEELVADVARLGGREAAETFFEDGMTRVWNQAAQLQDPGFPMVVFYAFQQRETDNEGTASTGWETFLHALLSSGLAVTATWPVRTEMPGGVRNFGRNSLASSIVLACRPKDRDAALATRSEFVGSLKSELPSALRLLQVESIAPVDLAQSAIGPGMAIFSRYSKVLEADGTPMSVRHALVLINEVLQEVLSAEETEFDPDTRWAVTWYEQYGLGEGPYGDAETLSRAKGTSVDGVLEAGVAQLRDGKVRLVARDEMDPAWNPISDRRTTVWEMTQHLIRRLQSGETSAAALLRQGGPGFGDRARQLTYLLYALADRKGWAKEAVAYNGLIVAWPELTRLAATQVGPVQTVFGDDV